MGNVMNFHLLLCVEVFHGRISWSLSVCYPYVSGCLECTGFRKVRYKVERRSRKLHVIILPHSTAAEPSMLVPSTICTKTSSLDPLR
jgi:hypothetical protein